MTYDDVTFSPRYYQFMMPTEDVLKEERRFLSLSKTEKEIDIIYKEMLEGKISRLSDSNEDDTCYEDIIQCILFWAVEDNEITQEESNRLYAKYVG